MQQYVWVAYATSEQQFHLKVIYQAGMTAADAIAQSGLSHQVQLPEKLSLGIWGVKISSAEHALKAGDRVEIYLPLTINPKDIRRNRAEKNPVGRYQNGNRSKRSS
ncbi:RnfH family protein [Acinetobacter sp. MD2(2019)]|uniref:RnfH family protein n=1 Tax=Acinetobacter sp. MD2(2019) TaxID=2605273 RepID=UPI002D1F33A9|nr:RnfH family protein [Acinetobacter sp. MD2(2019)]MEB3754728.1 RnfH family protein [Acinetobacter sp. MD2(2019)]